MWLAHRFTKFFSRTILVNNNDVDLAYKALDRILRNDGLIDRARRRLFHEKPYQTRNRLSLEKCKRVYNKEMRRKVEFVMRTNRIDPWLR